jgi:hypothetical protein
MTMSRLKDITGETFGRWEVLRFYGIRHSLSRNKHGKVVERTAALWTCRCSCGVVHEKVGATNLRLGKSQSCGCWQRERAKEFLTELRKRQHVRTKETN